MRRFQVVDKSLSRCSPSHLGHRLSVRRPAGLRSMDHLVPRRRQRVGLSGQHHAKRIANQQRITTGVVARQHGEPQRACYRGFADFLAHDFVLPSDFSLYTKFVYLQYGYYLMDIVFSCLRMLPTNERFEGPQDRNDQHRALCTLIPSWK
jgi:hypothetical protein